MPNVIVYVPRVLAPSLTFVEAQARGLQRWEPVLVGRRREAGLPIEDLLAFEMRDLRSRPLPELAANITRTAPALRACAARLQPDLVHAHFLTGGIDAVRTLRDCSVPLLVTAHGFDVTVHTSPFRTRRPEDWYLGLIRRRLVRSHAAFIAVSRFIRDRLYELGADHESVHLHYTGVDTNYFTPPPADQTREGVLFVGRLVPKKGVDVLLGAVRRLRAHGCNPPVKIIGDGPMRATLEHLVGSEGLPVTFLGSCPPWAVREAMRGASVLCAPSRTPRSGDAEGFGMVLAEAQATGTPVVGTDCGGMIEAMEDGVTGFMVPQGDEKALAAALRSVLIDEDAQRELGANARRHIIENFDLAKQNAQLESIYDRVAERGRS